MLGRQKRKSQEENRPVQEGLRKDFPEAQFWAVWTWAWGVTGYKAGNLEMGDCSSNLRNNKGKIRVVM